VEDLGRDQSAVPAPLRHVRLGGAFAITIVPAMLVVQGDLAATAHNIQTHGLLYRSGLAAHLVVTTINVPLAVIF
jgi:hypothetical protein